MNSITSEAKLSQVNPENTQLLNDFLDYLRSVQRSETTINGYENDIQIAWVWLGVVPRKQRK
jgi:site-specific recombinase XerD